eukprot:676242-Prorocentrum_lima.AAC.1
MLQEQAKKLYQRSQRPRPKQLHHAPSGCLRHAVRLLRHAEPASVPPCSLVLRRLPVGSCSP